MDRNRRATVIALMSSEQQAVVLTPMTPPDRAAALLLLTAGDRVKCLAKMDIEVATSSMQHLPPWKMDPPLQDAVAKPKRLQSHLEALVQADDKAAQGFASTAALQTILNAEIQAMQGELEIDHANDALRAEIGSMKNQITMLGRDATQIGAVSAKLTISLKSKLKTAEFYRDHSQDGLRSKLRTIVARIKALKPLQEKADRQQEEAERLDRENRRATHPAAEARGLSPEWQARLDARKGFASPKPGEKELVKWSWEGPSSQVGQGFGLIPSLFRVNPAACKSSPLSHIVHPAPSTTRPEPFVVIISGPQGAGKHRLARELSSKVVDGTSSSGVQATVLSEGEFWYRSGEFVFANQQDATRYATAMGKASPHHEASRTVTSYGAAECIDWDKMVHCLRVTHTRLQERPCSAMRPLLIVVGRQPFHEPRIVAMADLMLHIHVTQASYVDLCVSTKPFPTAEVRERGGRPHPCVHLRLAW